MNKFKCKICGQVIYTSQDKFLECFEWLDGHECFFILDNEEIGKDDTPQIINQLCDKQVLLFLENLLLSRALNMVEAVSYLYNEFSLDFETAGSFMVSGWKEIKE